MSLLQQQNFLARLYTDEKLRREFLSAPEKIGRENDLDEFEIADLTAVLPDEIIFFADSLFWKRLREVEKFLPLTKEFIGEDFTKLFKDFSQNFNPQSIKKHLEDAFEFCEFLEKNEFSSKYTKDVARFEQAKLEFFNYGKNFVFRAFQFNIREIIRRDAKSQIDFPNRKTFAIWLKIGKRNVHYIW